MNKVGKIITAIALCVSVIEIGMTISFYLFANMDIELSNINKYVTLK